MEKVTCKDYSYKLPKITDPLGKEVAFSYHFDPDTISEAATYDSSNGTFFIKKGQYGPFKIHMGIEGLEDD